MPMNREEYYHIEPLNHHDSMVRLVEETSVSLVFICVLVLQF